MGLFAYSLYSFACSLFRLVEVVSFRIVAVLVFGSSVRHIGLLPFGSWLVHYQSLKDLQRVKAFATTHGVCQTVLDSRAKKLAIKAGTRRLPNCGIQARDKQREKTKSKKKRKQNQRQCKKIPRKLHPVAQPVSCGAHKPR